MTPAAEGQASELTIFLRHSPDPARPLVGDKHQQTLRGDNARSSDPESKNGTTSAIAALHLRVDAGTKAYHRT